MPAYPPRQSDLPSRAPAQPEPESGPMPPAVRLALCSLIGLAIVAASVMAALLIGGA